MCNSYHIRYALCAHTIASANQAEHYWELCHNAVATGKRCDFAVLGDELEEVEGRCPECVAKWVAREEQLREKWRGRLRIRRVEGKGGSEKFR